VCVLALVALARSGPGPKPALPLRAAAPAARVQAVRALRQGESFELNQATAADLQLLPGVGPKLAQRIVEERTRRHGYRAFSELREVKGIGPAKLAQLASLLRVEPLQVEQPGDAQGDAEIQRLARPVGEHENGAGAQPQHELAPQ
jgi:predicted flap endonuclease-1-like 5' DNA nuclease